MRTLLFICFLLLSKAVVAQDVTLKIISSGVDASFRGLSVADDRVAWVSGSKGTIGVTRDGGATWKFSQVPGFEKFDFRSVYAFDESKAIIANAGAPANILLTTNGGATWKVVYTNTDTAAFIDGVDFWNEKEGMVYGDPINHRMLLVRTNDGGETWQELAEQERPLLNRGEASFAASGTNIRWVASREIMIATGGETSRIWHSLDKGSTWRTIPVPMLQGEPSTGIFSIARKGSRLIAVGGDYLRDTLTVEHVFYSADKGRTWRAPVQPTRGYRECVEFITADLVIATGPRGTDVSSDAGATWKALSDETGFHVVRKARNGKLVLMAGGQGKIALVEIK